MANRATLLYPLIFLLEWRVLNIARRDDHPLRPFCHIAQIAAKKAARDWLWLYLVSFALMILVGGPHGQPVVPGSAAGLSRNSGADINYT
jgi:hypothetical protein